MKDHFEAIAGITKYIDIHDINAYSTLMDIQNLQLFVQVAQLGSYAAVARQINQDPSLISRAITSLEKQLGFRLFHRTTRRLKLTEEAQLYLTRITPLLEELESAKDEANSLSNSPTGKLVITASIAFGQLWLLPLVNEFRQNYPDIYLDLRFTDQNLDLVAESIDLAFRLTPALDSTYVGYKLFNTRYSVCASSDYLSKYEVKPINKIKCIEALTFNLPEYQSRWIFKKSGKTKEVPVHSTLSISSMLALKQSVIDGQGIALLPHWMIKDELKAGTIKTIYSQYQVTATDFETSAWMLYPSQKYLPRRTRVFIDFIKGKNDSSR